MIIFFEYGISNLDHKKIEFKFYLLLIIKISLYQFISELQIIRDIS